MARAERRGGFQFEGGSLQIRHPRHHFDVGKVTADFAAETKQLQGLGHDDRTVCRRQAGEKARQFIDRLVHRNNARMKFCVLTGNQKRTRSGTVGAEIHIVSATTGKLPRISLKSFQNRMPSRHRLWQLLGLLLVGLIVALLVERLRGQWALRSWEKEMVAKGETFEVLQLWPPRSDSNREFSDKLTQATRALRGRLTSYAGQLSAIITVAPGSYRRGSQEHRPPRLHNEDRTNSWQDLDGLLQQNQATLQSMRELMKHPPATMGRELVKGLEDRAGLPNFVGLRLGAQALHVAALNDLHNGDHGKAVQDLSTLLAFARIYQQDPSLVTFMIRMAIVGLSVDACWDALQDAGWTESQLAALQQACLDIDRILPQMARTMESERVSRLYHYQWLRSHSYQAWVDRYREIYQGFGMAQLCPATAPPGQQWFFHPLWSFAWADQEEVIYLQQSQNDIATLREAARQRSWSWLKEQIATQHASFHRPAASWRFYLELPLNDRLSEVVVTQHIPEPAYPFPDFTRAWEATLGNLTRHEMVITAIALKRYALRHGCYPDQLTNLLPNLLVALPTDLMDGQPLRYRLNPDGTFVLYSVGENLRDDGGDFVPESTSDHGQDPSPWNGRDWVWPRNGTVANGPPVTSVSPRRRRG